MLCYHWGSVKSISSLYTKKDNKFGVCEGREYTVYKHAIYLSVPVTAILLQMQGSAFCDLIAL